MIWLFSSSYQYSYHKVLKIQFFVFVKGVLEWGDVTAVQGLHAVINRNYLHMVVRENSHFEVI